MLRLLFVVGLGGLFCSLPARAEAAAPSPKKKNKAKKEKAAVAADGEIEGESDEGSSTATSSIREKTRGNVGLGLLLGNPTALSLKVFVRPKHALQFGIGYAWLMSPEGAEPKGTYRLHIDYAWHPGAIASNQVMDLLPYVGVGIGSGFFIVRLPPPEGGDPQVRARPLSFMRLPVVGLAFHWQRLPMDTFIEASWTPALVWIPAPRGDIKFADFGLGFRYFF